MKPSGMTFYSPSAVNCLLQDKALNGEEGLLLLLLLFQGLFDRSRWGALTPLADGVYVL